MSHIWIGHTEARDPARGDMAGASNFYYVFPEHPGGRGGIRREYLPHRVVALHSVAHLVWEKHIHSRSAALDLPAARMITGDDSSLTTELVGPSVKSLCLRDQLPAPLSADELAAVLANTLLTAARFADAGYVHVDGHLGNYMVTLEDGLEGGTLCLDNIQAVDFTHTLLVNGVYGRPLWLSVGMAHFPPEARPLQELDEHAFAAYLDREYPSSFDGSTLGDKVRNLAYLPETEQRIRRRQIEDAYANYRVPTNLQSALDRGAIDPHAMMQFSIAASFLEITRRAPPTSTLLVMESGEEVIRRMADPRPEARFKSLYDAHTALIGCWPGTLPTRASDPWPAISPSYLVFDPQPGTDPDPSPLPHHPHEADTYVLEDDTLANLQHIEPSPAWRQNGIAWVRRHRLAAGVAVWAFISALCSLSVQQTPEELSQAIRRANIRHAMENLRAKDIEVVSGAKRQLKTIVEDQNHPDRDFVINVIDDRFKALDERWLRRPLFPMQAEASMIANHDIRMILISELGALAELHHAGVEQWILVLR